MVSVGLDIIPGVGNAKSAVEALIGRDLITGAELTKLERSAALLGTFTGGAGKTALNATLKIGNNIVGGSTSSVKNAAKGTGEAYNRNQHYGNTPSTKARNQTLERDDYTCQYCGSKDRLEADHNPSLKSHYQNGGKDMTREERIEWANDPVNLTTACKSCNTSKGAKNYPDQWTPEDKYKGRKKGK